MNPLPTRRLDLWRSFNGEQCTLLIARVADAIYVVTYGSTVTQDLDPDFAKAVPLAD